MRIISVLLYTLMYSSTRWNILAQQRKAFVNPQSECRIKCLNGGFCAYLVDNPSIHTCLCLLNVYYGDRCQYAVSETTTLSSNTTERSLSHRPSSPARTGKLSDYAETDEISQFGYTKVYQTKESKRIGSTEETKMDENDYTEGWDTTTGDDDEYSYDDRATETLDTVRTEASMPIWLQGSDDYRMITGQENPQRIYLNKKKTDQMVTRLNKDKRIKIDDEETLMQWTNENDSTDSQESMMESESTGDGWMISKRRRVITNDATVITNKPLKLTFFLIFFIMPLLRW